MLRRVFIYAVLVLVAADSARAAETTTVLILPFENLSNDRSLDWLGEGIAELVADRFQSQQGVTAFSRDERAAAYEKLGIPESTIISHATALKLGWDVGADRIIMGAFSGTAEDFQFSGRAVDMDLSVAPQDIKQHGRLDDVILLTTRLSLDLLKQVVPGTTAPEADYTTRPPTPRSAFENYIRGILNSDPQKRFDLLLTAVRLYPQYPSAIFQLGRAYHLEREFKTSNQWLTQVAQTSPDWLQARFMIGLNCFYLGDFDCAISTLQQLPPTYDVLLNLGSAYSHMSDDMAAIAAWRRAAEKAPLEADPFFNIGYVSLLSGDLDVAERQLNESLKLHGHESEALFLLGRAYERQGRSDESQRLTNQAARLSQRVERWLTQPIPRLERVSTSATFKDPDEIWTSRRLDRRAKSQDLTAWLEVVQNKIDSNLYGEAISELRDVLRVFPGSAEAESLLDDVDRLRNSK